MVEEYQVLWEEFYSESSGNIFLVEVLDNKDCNTIIEKYLLRIKEVIKRTEEVDKKVWKKGYVFECQKLRQSGKDGLWTLVKNLDEVQPETWKAKEDREQV